MDFFLFYFFCTRFNDYLAATVVEGAAAPERRGLGTVPSRKPFLE